MAGPHGQSRTSSVLFASAVIFLASCGGSDDPEPVVAVPGDPIVCLEGADLVSVEDRGGGTWRGTHADLGYLIIINEHASAAEARELVNDAVDVYAEHAGIYSVTGPATPAAGGLLEGDEPLEANRLVQGVAACLRG